MQTKVSIWIKESSCQAGTRKRASCVHQTIKLRGLRNSAGASWHDGQHFFAGTKAGFSSLNRYLGPIERRIKLSTADISNVAIIIRTIHQTNSGFPEMLGTHRSPYNSVTFISMAAPVLHTDNREELIAANFSRNNMFRNQGRL